MLTIIFNEVKIDFTFMKELFKLGALGFICFIFNLGLAISLLRLMKSNVGSVRSNNLGCI